MIRSFDHPVAREARPFCLLGLLALAACASEDARDPALPPAAPGPGAPAAAPPANGTSGSAAPAFPPPGGTTPPTNVAAGPTAGSPAGGAGNPAVTDPLPPTAAAGAGGSAAPVPGVPPDSECDAAAAFEPLVPRDGEKCYEFRTHGQSSPTDTSKFDVPVDESYNQFYFDVPWGPGEVATRFGAKLDNVQVLHHWLAFASDRDLPAGTVERNVTGTTIGENAHLIGGWAVGGCNVEFPPDMGLRLRSSGKIMIQWHHYNYTGMPQQDGTTIQFCTVQESTRENIGGITWLGSENIYAQPGQKAETFGTCVNDSQKPITIVAFWPHMHEIGIHMKSEVQRGGAGAWSEVFSKPFSFNHQVHYKQTPHLVLQPGDQIRSTCTFMNTTSGPVGFGQSSKAEMCYQFAYSYPEGALDNGVLSLIGATNTCWQFGE
jgi:hypothetical protein